MTDHTAPGHALENIAHWATVQGDAPWLVDLHGGEPTVYTWAVGKATIERAATAISAYFGGARKKAAVLSKNRAHWIMADMAILRAGAVTVPVFTTMRPETFHYVLDFAEVELLFLGESANWAEVREHLPEGITVVTLPGVEPSLGDISWEAFLAKGDSLPLPAMPDGDEVATIIFTSGTTGKPKGVMHSLNSLKRATDGLVEETGSTPGWRFFSYLPLAHLAERLVIELHAIRVGGVIHFNEGLETFTSDLGYAKPDYFFGVPRIWEKLVQGVLGAMGGDAGALKAALMGPNAAAVSASIREKLGLASVKSMLSTTAPVPPATKEWFDLFGLSLLDGYGQTEILPITTTSGHEPRHGSVGKPVKGVELKITDEGELVVRAHGISLGYYNAPDKNTETFRDGWVYTGDRAHIDEEGYVYLRGRVKETFKTAKGKYVAPGPIETLFQQSELVEQACIVGHGLPQPVVILVPSELALSHDSDTREDRLYRLTAEINAGLERHAQIGGIIVASEPWTIENAVLTHTMKVRRERVLLRYGTMANDIAGRIGGGSVELMYEK
ncbi:AMP-binding protein [Kordiimonas aestuarii]|uniref:AMP-binding protein n=1 Tax=Kordiimonas aestuarii TaxID=1005925 RepID=UPI0021D3C829|nr:AMP-binding protein [Kordiimonas aestuarii]